MSKEVDGVLIKNWVKRNLLGNVSIRDLPTTLQDYKWKYAHKERSPFTTRLMLKKLEYESPKIEAVIEGPADVPYLFVPFGWYASYAQKDREAINLRFVVLEPTAATAKSTKGRNRGKVNIGEEIPNHLVIFPPLKLLNEDQYLDDILTRSLLPISIIASVSKYHTGQAWRRLIGSDNSTSNWVNATIAETVELVEKLCVPKKGYY